MGFTLQASGDQTGDDLNAVLDDLAGVFAKHSAGILSADATRTDDDGTTSVNLLAPSADDGDGSDESGAGGAPSSPTSPASPAPVVDEPPAGNGDELAAFEAATNGRLDSLEHALQGVTASLSTLVDQVNAIAAGQPSTGGS